MPVTIRRNSSIQAAIANLSNESQDGRRLRRRWRNGLEINPVKQHEKKPGDFDVLRLYWLKNAKNLLLLETYKLFETNFVVGIVSLSTFWEILH